MKKGEQTRATIVDRAMALVSRVGLEGLSIGALADDVGMSKSGLFAHFKSKQDLQLAILEASIDRFMTTVVSPAFREPRGVPRIRALFENWLRWSNHPSIPGGCIFLSLASELDDRPGPQRDCLAAYQKEWIEGLATSARMGVEQGHFRKDLDVEQFAYDFYSIILAYHHFTRLIRDPGAEKHARRAFEQLLAASKP